MSHLRQTQGSNPWSNLTKTSSRAKYFPVQTVVPAPAGQGLQECPGILPSSLVILLMGVGMKIFLFAGVVCATYIGKAQAHRHRAFAIEVDGDIGYCTDAKGKM